MLSVILFIFANNIGPILIIIILGYLLNKSFELSIDSFSKINFYIFTPALVFISVYETQIAPELFRVLIFGIMLVIILYAIGHFIAIQKDYSVSFTSAFSNSFIFYNAGNYTLPLIALVFNNSSFAISVQIMILLVQVSLMNTFGFINAAKGNLSLKKVIKKILYMPPIYAVFFALILKAFPRDITQNFVWSAIEFLKQGFVPIALLTLGIQLSNSKLTFKNKSIYLACIIRLIISPMIAYLLILIFNFQVITSQVLLISSAVPSAVITALIAIELKNEPEFAAQTVFMTTLFSIITIPIIIYISQIIFK